MQAIVTKYIGPTERRGSRIKASCERGSVTIGYPHELSGDNVHIAAANALVEKFIKEDKKRFGDNVNPWAGTRVCGCIGNGVYAHVFTEDTTPATP